MVGKIKTFSLFPAKFDPYIPDYGLNSLGFRKQLPEVSVDATAFEIHSCDFKVQTFDPRTKKDVKRKAQVRSVMG